MPADGALPPAALAAVGQHGFGVYLHVPFCATRCGYCDFNTYTGAELGSGRIRETFPDAVVAELALAGRVLDGARPRRVDTVFVGGGTPTLLPPDALARMLERIDATFGLSADAEVTTEANPESVDPPTLRRLRAAGFNRLSLGMQSTVPHVLAVLDRRHSPGRATAAVAEAHDAGFARVNLDLIYGTPAETADDLATSVQAAIDAGVDHVSAYALIVEDGTALARRIRQGEVPEPDEDVVARRYVSVDRALRDAGFSWYEVSNWSRGPAARCRHNQCYWTGADWWGLGPGAHSHVGGVRWWNVKHPGTYADRLARGVSPGAGREVLSGPQRRTERVMLGIRLVDGLPVAGLPGGPVAEAYRDGLLDPDAYRAGRAVLTLRGRLFADAVTHRMLES